MSDLISRIAEAIEAEMHEAWTESDAGYNRGMEYAVAIVKAMDIRTDGDLISRQDAIERIDEYINEYKYNQIKCVAMKEARAVLELLPSAETPTASEKHQLSADTSTNTPTDLISRQAAIDAVWNNNITRDEITEELESLPSVQPSGDLISRESALAEFRDGRDVYDIMESIEELPSVPDSRQRGEWIFKPKDAIELMFTKPRCSECGFESADGGNFCSNCGADMRRGGEDE